MRIKILSSAVEDLHTGRLFYESQGAGLGAYFLDSLFSDIDSLKLYAGIHCKVYGYHRLLSRRFPYPVYYTFEDDLRLSGGFWTCAAVPESSAGISRADKPAKYFQQRRRKERKEDL